MPLNIWTCLLIFSISNLSSAFISPRIRSKYVIKSKFDVNGVFSKFNMTESSIDPDPRRSVLLVLLKPGCPHSRKFERRINELVNNLETQSFKSRFEFRIYECPPDQTCAKIFNAKSYPEIRFYSVRESPRKYFLRFSVKKDVTVAKILKWANRRRELSTGNNDIFHFDGDMVKDKGKHLDKGDGKMENMMKKQLREMKKRMRRYGYYYGELTQFINLEFWKRIYKRVVEQNKELLIFCRDAFSKKEYYNFRKILSLYPNMRVFEIRKCSKYITSKNSQEFIKKTKSFISHVFGTDTKSWSRELGSFMKNKFNKIFSNLSSKNSKMFLVNFEQLYLTSFKNTNMTNVKQFRRIFKGRRRPNIVYLTSNVMKNIMYHSQPVIFLFLNSTESMKERRSIMRSFKKLSKIVRYDKNLLFVPIGGKNNFLAGFYKK